MTRRPRRAQPTDATATLDGRVGRPVARNLATLASSRAVGTVLQFVAFATLAAALGPSRLGKYVFAIAVPGLLKLLADFGFQASVARDVAQDPSTESTSVPNLFYLRLVLGLVCYGIIRAALPVLGYDRDIRSAATVTAISLMVVSLEAFRISLEIRLRMVWVAVADLVEAVVMFVGILVLASRHAGLTGFLWLYVVANGLNLGILAVRGTTLAPLRWKPLVRTWWPVIRSAAPLGAATLVIALYYRLDVVILARIRSADAVGQYGTAYRFLDAFGVLPGLLMAVLNPILSRSVVSGGAVLRRRFETIAHLIVVPGLLVAVTGAMTAWRVLPALPGFEKYKGAGVALSILSPAAMLILFGAVLSGILINAHLQRRLLQISLVILVLNLALNVVLIPLFSYIGAAVATAISELVVVVAQLFVLGRELELRIPVRRGQRLLLSAGVLAAALAVTSVVSPFVQVAVGVVAYLVALVVTRALHWDDLAALRTPGGPTALVIAPSAAGTDAPPPPDDGTRRVPPAGAAATWKALRGSSACRIVSDGRTREVVYAGAARLAGCSPVVLEVVGARRRSGPWTFFVDDVTGP